MDFLILSKNVSRSLYRYFLKIRILLDLSDDFDEEGCTNDIKANAEFRSANAWCLIFAIFIASIGLQVNSTAVIIGAMLISPLMGSIVGAGFALGTYDFELLTNSLKNLGYALLISLTTSTLFFLISSSGLPQSELLARTQPTFFDVMIAFFGGAAGIVAMSRKSKGNAIPGVAIATALMPPLCTAGYGLANLNFSFVLGALYLFLINATFIFFATFLFTKILKFKVLPTQNVEHDKLIRKWMPIGGLVITLPSIVMAWYLNKKTSFETTSSAFIENEFKMPNTFIGKKSLSFSLKQASIDLKTVGHELTPAQIESLNSALKNKYKLNNVQLNIQSLNDENFKMDELEQKFVSKNDLLRMRQNDEENRKNLILQKEELLREKLKQKYPDLFQNVEIQDNLVKITWRSKSYSKKTQEAETLALGWLVSEPFKFSHELESTK